MSKSNQKSRKRHHGYKYAPLETTPDLEEKLTLLKRMFETMLPKLTRAAAQGRIDHHLGAAVRSEIVPAVAAVQAARTTPAVAHVLNALGAELVEQLQVPAAFRGYLQEQLLRDITIERPKEGGRPKGDAIVGNYLWDFAIIALVDVARFEFPYLLDSRNVATKAPGIYALVAETFRRCGYKLSEDRVARICDGGIERVERNLNSLIPVISQSVG